MLQYGTLRYVTLWYVMVCYITVCYGMLRYGTLQYGTEQFRRKTSATERWSAFLGGKSVNDDFISLNGNLVPQGQLTNTTQVQNNKF